MGASAGGGASRVSGMVEPLLYRLLGRRQRLLWPPSRDSAPLLILGWLALTAPLARLLRRRKSRDIALVEERRREHALWTLANVIDNEELRLAAEDAKPSPPPALAEKLFTLLFDEIEHHDITAIGVSKTDPRFVRGMELLRIHTSRELREAIDKTRQARSAVQDDSIDDVPTEGRQFADGRAMRRLMRFVKNNVLTHMRAGGGKTCSDEFDRAEVATLKALVKEAAAFSSAMQAENRRAMAIIWRLIKPFRWQVALGTALSFVAETAAASVAVSSIQLPFIANRAGSQAEVMAYAYQSCLSHFVLWTFHRQASMIADAMVGHAKADFVMRLRNATMHAILSQDREYHDIHTVGVLQERINHTCRVTAQHLVGHPKMLVVKVFKICVRLVYMYAISPRLFVISLALPLPLGYAVAWLGTKTSLKLSRKINKINELAVSGTIDVLKEMTTVRQFAMEDYEHEKYALTNIFRRMLEQRLDVLQKLTHLVIEGFYVSMNMVVTYFGISLCQTGVITPATVFTFNIYNREIANEIRWVSGDLIPAMIGMTLPLGLLCAVLGSAPTIEPPPSASSTLSTLSSTPSAPRSLAENAPHWKRRPAKFRGHIVFEDVYFRYPTELQKPVLRGVSFEVKPGQKVALVGKTGCGKSTAVNLVQRLYDVEAGSISIDGEPISSYDVRHLRRHIGIVSQDNILFSMSIKDNITYGMGQGHLPMPTEAEIWTVCEKANAVEFIQEFPNKLHQMIGEKGVRLSGGQKQRIAIARAMIRSPTILLLDEATSALDAASEMVVQKALDELLIVHKGVALVVAHRLTTIKNCDRIVVMEKGKNVEQGSHDELLQIQVRQDGSSTSHHNGATSSFATRNASGGEICKGYYHHQWNTQMGEESFGAAEHMSGEQLDARELHLETQHAREIAKLQQERAHRATRWSAVREQRDAVVGRLKVGAEGASGSGVQVVDEAAFAMAMAMVDEWAPSADWEDGLKILQKAVHEDDPHSKTDPQLEPDVVTEKNGCKTVKTRVPG